MNGLAKSRIIPPSDIDGVRPSPKRLSLNRLGRDFRSSLTLKLVLLVGVFATLPILLAGHFEQADRKMRNLVTRGIERQNALIAEALKPVLDSPHNLPTDLSAKLTKFSGDNTLLKLMLRPLSEQGAEGFYFVAAAPPLGEAQTNAELNRLQGDGVLGELMPTCTWKTPALVRQVEPGGSDEVLTSVIPIDSRWGCWVLISSHSTSEFLNTSLGGPYWSEPEIRLAVTVYLVMAALAALTAWSLWRNLHQFRRVAGRLRQGRDRDRTFSAQNQIPELASVAADFDDLVDDLHTAARNLRRRAEDNAHSFKSPVATIAACLGTLRRRVAPADAAGNRAAALIESSLDRLTALIADTQRLDHLSADLIEAPHERFNLGKVVSSAVLRYSEVARARNIRQKIELDGEIYLRGNPDAAALVIENLLDNAISFSPVKGTVEVTLTHDARGIELHVADEGPGIDPDKIHEVFERYVSLRPHTPDGEKRGHSGLGLWLVRHHVEALGGSVMATNRVGGGTCIAITFPAHAEVTR